MTMLTLAPPTPVAGTAGAGTDQPALGITAPARTAGPIATARAVAGRTTRRFVRTPQLLVVSTISGAMFLLIFRYVFGGAINTGGIPYVDFLVNYILSDYPRYRVSALAGVLCVGKVLLP